MADNPSSSALDPGNAGPRRRQRPGLAVALPLVIVAAAALAQLLGGWLEGRQDRLKQAWEVRARATALELVDELEPAARKRVLAAVSREIEAVQRGGAALELGPLQQVVDRCGRAADKACAAALARLEGWQEEGRIPVLWSWGLRLGLLALLGLITGILGWYAVKHTRGRLAGLCLMGVVLVIAGAAWRGVASFQQDEVRHRTFALDHLVAWGRLMVDLPADRRATRFAKLIGALKARPGEAQPLVTPGQLRELRAAVKRCQAPGPRVRGVRVQQRCGEVLAALARIHADNRDEPPTSRVREWISRWLHWTGVVFLLLAALISAARGGRADGG